MDHDAAHQKKETEDGALLVVEEAFDADHVAEPGDGGIGRLPEKVYAYAEQDGIQDAGDEDPFPELMFADEMMRFDIRLEGYNNFFEQSAFLFILSD